MKNRADHLAFLMPYLADLLAFMVIFEWMLSRHSGPPAYHHQGEHGEPLKNTCEGVHLLAQLPAIILQA